MKFIDISWPIFQEMTEYKNRKSVQIKILKTIADDGVFESQLQLHSHTGTHIDAPCHFLNNGHGVNTIPFDSLVGPCRVLDLAHIKESITARDLEKYAITASERIVLKTKNSAFQIDAPFETGFVYLDKTAAQYLADKKIKTVGIDYLGIERSQPNHETHTILMNSSITIIEGLRLESVNAGNYELICLPLLLPNLDAAPARAILKTI